MGTSFAAQNRMDRQPPVCIVILNYRNYPDTIECVRSVERIRYPDYRVVIVDNASDNESQRILQETFPRHRVVQAGRNGGYAAGNNVGIRIGLQEGAEFLLLLNNDTLVEPDFLDVLVAYALAHPQAGLLSPRIIEPGGGVSRRSTRRRPRLRDLAWNLGVGRWLGTNKAWLRWSYYEDEYDFAQPKEVDVVSGSCMLMRRSLIDAIGLLDENTFLFYEEFILHEKMRATPFRSVVVPASQIFHKEGHSVRTIGTRAALARLSSLNYYLRRYRKTTPVVRWIILLSVLLSAAPGMLKTVLGLRKLERHMRREHPSR
jgi:GT2 family glycosyltransferase